MDHFLGLYPRLVWFAPLVLGKGNSISGPVFGYVVLCARLVLGKGNRLSADGAGERVCAGVCSMVRTFGAGERELRQWPRFRIRRIVRTVGAGEGERVIRRWWRLSQMGKGCVREFVDWFGAEGSGHFLESAARRGINKKGGSGGCRLCANLFGNWLPILPGLPYRMGTAQTLSPVGGSASLLGIYARYFHERIAYWKSFSGIEDSPEAGRGHGAVAGGGCDGAVHLAVPEGSHGVPGRGGDHGDP